MGSSKKDKKSKEDDEKEKQKAESFLSRLRFWKSKDEDKDATPSTSGSSAATEFFGLYSHSLTKYTHVNEVKRRVERLSVKDAGIVVQMLDDAMATNPALFESKLLQVHTILVLLQTRQGDDKQLESPANQMVHVWWMRYFLESYDPTSGKTPFYEYDTWRTAFKEAIQTAANTEIKSGVHRPERLVCYLLLMIVHDTSEQAYCTHLENAISMASKICKFATAIKDFQLHEHLQDFLPVLQKMQWARKTPEIPKTQVVDVMLRALPECESLEAALPSRLTMINHTLKEISLGDPPQPNTIKILAELACKPLPTSEQRVSEWFTAFLDWSRGIDGKRNPKRFVEMCSPLVFAILHGDDPRLFGSSLNLFRSNFPGYSASVLNTFVTIFKGKNLDAREFEVLPADIQKELVATQPPVASSLAQRDHFGTDLASSLKRVASHIDHHYRVLSMWRLVDVIVEYSDWFPSNEAPPDFFNATEMEQLLFQSIPKLKLIEFALPKLHYVNDELRATSPYPVLLLASTIARTLLPSSMAPAAFPARFIEIVSTLADPSQRLTHVPPGLLALFINHYLLEAILSYTQEDMSLLFDSSSNNSAGRTTLLEKVIHFLQWFDSTQSKIDSLYPSLKPLSEASLAKKAVFYVSVAEFFAKVADVDITLSQAFRIVSCTHLKKFLDFIQVAGDTGKLTSNLIKEKEKYAKDAVLMMTSFNSWFKEVNLTNKYTVLTQEDIHNKTIKEIGHATEMFKASLIMANFNDTLIDSLHAILLPQKSQLFSLVFNQQAEEYSGQAITPKVLATILQATCKHLGSMFSEDSSFSKIADLWEVADKLGPARLKQELAQLNNIVKSSGSLIAIDELSAHIERGSSLRSYAENIPKLKRFLGVIPDLAQIVPSFARLSPACRNLIDEVIATHDRLLRLNHLQVRNIKSELEAVQTSMRGLEPHILVFFETLAEQITLIRFCNRPDFHEKVGILTGQLQGMAFAKKLIDSLVNVQVLLSPVLNFETLDQFFVSVNAMIGKLSSDDLDRRLRHFELCQTHLTDLETYFSGSTGDSAAAMLPTAIRSLESGRFLIRSSLHPKGFSIILQQFKKEKVKGAKHRELETSLEGQNLHGRLRGMTVFLDRSSLEPDQIIALKTFDTCYSCALDIANAFESLVGSGHPAYQLAEFQLGRGREDMSIDKYEEVLEELKHAAESWNETLVQVANRCPRLFFLTPKTIAGMIRKVDRLFTSESTKNDEDWIFQRLLPYLLLCFPDVHGTTSALPFTPSMVSEEFLSHEYDHIMEQNHLEKDDEALWEHSVRTAAILHHVAEIVSSLARHPRICQMLENAGIDKIGKPRVIKAVDMKPTELFKVVAQACEQIPHPSQILYCSPSTTFADLDRFLVCSKHFQTMFYVIYAVNELTHDVRQHLLHWTSSVASQVQSNHAQVILLFTAERSGEDMFGFLATEAATGAITNFNFSEKTADILRARNISSFHCLFNSQGKSSCARQHLKASASHKTVELSISEHFRRDKFIHQLSKLISENDPLKAIKVGLHLDIKPYANMQALSRFLNDWFYFGFVFDPSTGDAFYSTPAGVKPGVLSGIEWNIVVEVTSPMRGDPDFSYLVPSEDTITPPILLHLPSVYYLRSSEKIKDFELPVTPKMRLLAGLLQWHSTNQALAPSKTIGSELTDAQVLGTVKAKWNHITRLRRFRAIVELMCESAHDFTNFYILMGTPYTPQLLETLRQYGKTTEMAILQKKLSGSRELFQFLLDEAEYLSNTAEKAKSVPLIIRRKIPDELPEYQRGRFEEWEIAISDIYSIGTDWCAVSFTEPDAELVKRCPLPVSFFGRPDQHHLRSEQRQHLRMRLAEALGVNSYKMWSIIEQKRYVLTPHLAHKMLHLHARRGARNNVILVGDTGQGKTEMVDFYSLFLNLDSPDLPDLLNELSKLATSFIYSMYRNPLPIKRPASDKVTRMDVLKILLDISRADKPVEPAPLPAPPPAASQDLVLIAQPPVPAPVPVRYIPTEPYLTPANDENDSSCWPDLRETLNTWLATMFNRYPLLQRTAELNQLSPSYDAGGNDAADSDTDDDTDDDSDDDDGEDVRNPKFRVPPADLQVWKKKSLEQILNKILDIRIDDLFHKELMYKGLSIGDFSKKVLQVKASAEKWPNMQVLFFVDESNTTSFMGHLKELLVDHRWNNEPLPSNVFIVAAINPQEIDRAHGQLNVTQSRVDFSKNLNVQTGARAVSAFDVRPPHPSMEELYYYFTEMDEAADDDFWEAMIELGASEIHEDERRTVIEYVLLGHHQIRKALIGNMHPSIRDLVRALTLFKFFRRSTFGAILLQERQLMEVNAANSLLPIEDLQEAFSEHFWKALFMTLAVGYYFRLLNLPTTSNDSRLTLLQAINSKYENEPGARRKGEVSFKHTVDEAIHFLFRETNIPSAIAPTLALMENLFCTVICVDMKMPLTISGPAGCSKTLSFTIAIDNMRGAGSKRLLYRNCQQMHHYRYQCSPMSSDEEISAVYDDATSRQIGLSSTQVREMCTVLLDELNLAEKGSSQPLKVIHGKLDHPKVMTVILTNKLLDPAKTNRTLQVLQSIPSEDDLLRLARSCLFETHKDEFHYLTPHETAIIEGAKEAYTVLSKRTDLTMKFQLRDFVYFLRSLRNNCRDPIGTFKMTPNKLLNAILRNFGGLSDPREQAGVVKLFFESINQKIDVGSHFQVPASPQTPTQILRESVNDTIPLTEMNPNINSSRYICLLDPSDSCTSVNLLFEMGIVPRDKATIIACSEFSLDATEEGINERVMKVKDAMANGDTVILVAADGIYGNFYDLFNKHFTIVPAENPKDGEPLMTFFSNVAVGSLSRPCKVHPSFKVIVHLPISQLPNTPLPFLSRFEKYVLSIDHCLQEKVATHGLTRTMGAEDGTQLDALIDGVTHFCDTMRARLVGRYPFHGFVPHQTIKSLAMATLARSHGSILDPVPLPRFLVDGTNDITPDSIPMRNERGASWVQYLIRMTNFRLLQIVRPDAASEARFLPRDYLVEYFMRQEHLSVAHLLRSVLIAKDEKSSNSYSFKWVISSRSSDEMARMHTDKAIQDIISSGVKTEIDFLALSTFSSLAHLNNALAEFVQSEKGCLLITADMRTCSTSQINDLRREVDNHIRDLAVKRHIFVLLHHPPEHAQSPHDAYPSIFWEDWDFYYSDSLGLSSIDEGGVLATLAEDENDSDSDEEDEPIDEVRAHRRNAADARAWIAKAVGLEVEISPESVLRHFREQFHNEFAASLKLLHTPNLPAARRLKYASRIYLDRITRQKELLTLFKEEPDLIDIILKQFAYYWTDSLLHNIVAGTGDAIRDGKATGAYVPLIQNSLRFMLISVCKQLLDTLLGNFNMEGITQTLRELKNPETKAVARKKMNFVLASLHLVPPPSVDAILAASQVDQNVGDENMVRRGFKLGKGIVTSLPLFDVVSNAVLRAVVNAMRNAGISSIQENLDTFIHNFTWILKDNEELAGVLHFIDSDPLLQELFFDDFIHHQLGTPKLTPSLSSVVKLLLKSRLDQLKSKVPIPAVAVFLLTPDVRNTISHIGLCLVPLNALNASSEDVESLISGREEEFMHAPLPQMEGIVHEFTVNLLKMALLSKLDDPDLTEDEKVAQVWRWFVAIRDVHIRISSARFQKACSGPALLFYHRMLLLYQVVTSFQLNQSELFQLVMADRSAGMNGSLRAETKDLRSALLEVPKLVAKVAAIREEEEQTSASLKRGLVILIQAIVSRFISFDPYTHTKVQGAQSLVSSIRLFLKMAGECDLDIPDSIKAHLTSQWYLSQLSGLISKVLAAKDHQSEWFELLQQLSRDAVKEAIPEQYAPFAPFLTSEDEIIESGKFVDENGQLLVPVRTFVGPHKKPFNPLQVIWFEIFLNLFSYQQISADYTRLKERYDALSSFEPIDHVQKVACVTCLVRIFANAFSNPQDFEKHAASWGRNSFSFMKTIIFTPHDLNDCLARGLPADIIPFFFACIKTTEGVQELLSSDAAELGLAEEWQVADADSLNARHFRWMNINEPKDHRYTMYKEINAHLEMDDSPAALNGLLAKIDALVAPNPDILIYDLRMVLVMALFANWMSEGEACEVIRTNLAPGSPLVQKLGLRSALEIAAFSFVSSGPLVGPNLTETQKYFSKQVYDENQRFDDNALLLIMHLATTLGMPADSNHMYTLAFNTTSINRYTPFVASTFRHHADCGFISDFSNNEIKLVDAPNILGNHPRHRLALNTSYWAAFTWAFLLDPQVTTAHATNAHNHILNDRRDSSVSTCTTYAYTRASTFSYALEKVGIEPKKPMDPLFYMSEFLLRLQATVNKADRIAAWKAQYPAPQFADVDAYHAALTEHVFGPLDRELLDRAGTYLDMAAQQGHVMEYISEIRRRPLTQFSVSLPSASTISTWLSQRKASILKELNEEQDEDVEEQRGEETLLSYVERFMGIQTPLVANRLIPAMVQYFDHLSSVADGRFTTEELLTMTLREMFEKLRENQLESQENIEKLVQLTSTFSSNVKLFRMLIPALDGCGIVDRAFEYEVSEVDIDKTPPGLLLGIKPESGELASGNFDRIRAMVRNLVDRHNACILDRSNVRASGWNENQILFSESNSSSPVVPLHALQQSPQHQSEQNFALVTGDIILALKPGSRGHIAGASFDASEFITPFCSPIYSFIASSLDAQTGEPDWRRVAEYIASFYTGGRHELAHLPEWIISERKAVTKNETFKAEDAPSVLNSFFGYAGLLNEAIIDFGSILPANAAHKDNRKLWISTLTLDTRTLDSACKHFYQILRHFIKKYQNDRFLALDALKNKIGDFERDAQLPIYDGFSEQRESIFMLNGFYLSRFASFLVESYNEYRHFYTEKRRVKFQSEFSDVQRDHYNAIVFSLGEQVDLEKFLDNLSTLKKTLSDERMLVLAETKQMKEPLIRLLDDKRGNLENDFVESLLPNDVCISHFTTLLRKLEVLAKDCKAKLRDLMPEVEEKDVYKELVPDHFISTDAQLDGEFVEKPVDFGERVDDFDRNLDYLVDGEILGPAMTEAERVNEFLFGTIQTVDLDSNPISAATQPTSLGKKYTQLGPQALDKEISPPAASSSSGDGTASSSQPLEDDLDEIFSTSPPQPPVSDFLPFLGQPVSEPYHPAMFGGSYAQPPPFTQPPAGAVEYARSVAPIQQPTWPTALVSPSNSAAAPPTTSNTVSHPPVASSSHVAQAAPSSSLRSSRNSASSSPLTESQLLKSYADQSFAISENLKAFSKKWREFNKTTALGALAKSLGQSRHVKDLIKHSSALADERLVVFAEQEKPDGSLNSKISSGGTTYLHVALKLANWTACNVLVLELESNGHLTDMVNAETEEGLTVARLALNMLAFALDQTTLSDDDLWEVIASARLLDILVVASHSSPEIRDEANGLFARLNVLRPDLRLDFESWHEGPIGGKYDSDYDFNFP